MDKPIYLGMSILEISKTLMYDFHYNYIKPKYGNKANLLFTDTDSLMYEIRTEDVYKDISKDVKSRFDTSAYPKEHPSGIPTRKIKRFIGLFKDESGGEPIIEFVGLRPNVYNWIDLKEENRKCKGVDKKVTQKELSMQDYKDCLYKDKEKISEMNTIRSRKHELFTEKTCKSSTE